MSTKHPLFSDTQAALEAELNAFSGRASLLMTDLTTGQVLHAHNPDARVVSASTIKLPILLAALDSVQRGRLRLDELLPVPAAELLPDTQVFERGIAAYTFWELLYWMIVASDNTATNRVIETLGYDTINCYVNSIGLVSTACQRKMLDWAAIEAGRNNYTSNSDQCRMYTLLHRGEILTPALRETALDMLRRQRCQDTFLRYIPHNITVAHKTGGLDYVNHDAGIFYATRPYYLGVFTWDGPSQEGDPRQKQFIARLAKIIFDTYR